MTALRQAQSPQSGDRAGGKQHRCVRAEFKVEPRQFECRLSATELVLENFIGIPPDQLLERLLELTLYTEESLR